MLSRAIDKRFRPRAWLGSVAKRHSNSVASASENATLAQGGVTLSSPEDLTIELMQPAGEVARAKHRTRLRLPLLFSSRKATKNIPVPKHRASDSAALSRSAPEHALPAEQKKSAVEFEEDRLDSVEDLKHFSVDQGKSNLLLKTRDPEHMVMRMSASSELSEMTTRLMTEEVKARLQIQETGEQSTRRKGLNWLKLTESPAYPNDRSSSSGDLMKQRPVARWTTLHSAMELGSGVEIVSKLAESTSVDLFAVTEDGETALHIAARNRNAQVCIYLVKLGCDPYCPNFAQKTPVQLAGSELGYMMILAYWSMLKTRVESDNYSDIAIHAARSGSRQILKELAELGADLKNVHEKTATESLMGRTLAEIARQSGFLDLSAALEIGDLNSDEKCTSSANVSFSKTSDEVKAWMNADTGTDVLISPAENVTVSQVNRINEICVAVARQLSQDLELSPSIEYDDEEEFFYGGNLQNNNVQDTLDALDKLTNNFRHEKRPSRFSIRELPEDF